MHLVECPRQRQPMKHIPSIHNMQPSCHLVKGLHPSVLPCFLPFVSFHTVDAVFTWLHGFNCNMWQFNYQYNSISIQFNSIHLSIQCANSQNTFVIQSAIQSAILEFNCNPTSRLINVYSCVNSIHLFKFNSIQYRHLLARAN